MSQRNKEVVSGWIKSFKTHFNKHENLLIAIGLVVAYVIGYTLGKIS